MLKRLLNQLSLVGALGVLSFASTVQAEPVKPDDRAGSATQTPSQEVAEVQVSPVMLADGQVDTARETKEVNRKLLRSSILLLGASYVPTFIAAMVNSKQTDPTLYIPVLGPWLELDNDTSPGNKVLLVLSGVGQGLGTLGIISSFFVPESRTKNWPLLGSRRVMVRPMAGRGEYALAARGSF